MFRTYSFVFPELDTRSSTLSYTSTSIVTETHCEKAVAAHEKPPVALCIQTILTGTTHLIPTLPHTFDNVDLPYQTHESTTPQPVQWSATKVPCVIKVDEAFRHADIVRETGLRGKSRVTMKSQRGPGDKAVTIEGQRVAGETRMPHRAPHTLRTLFLQVLALAFKWRPLPPPP